MLLHRAVSRHHHLDRGPHSWRPETDALKMVEDEMIKREKEGRKNGRKKKRSEEREREREREKERKRDRE